MIVADFKDREGNWVQSFRMPGLKGQAYTWLGRKYKSFMDRAKIGGAEQKGILATKGATQHSTVFKILQAGQ